MTRIFASLPLTDAQIARLRAALAGDTLVLSTDFANEAKARAGFGVCEVAFGNAPAEWVATSPALRWMQLESVGLGDYITLDWATLGERVRLSNLAGFFADPVAESILAGILALYRGVDTLVRLQRERHWEGEALRPGFKTLRGARVVLFGFGAINQRVAALLAPFECHITALRRDWDAAALDGALAEADIVISTVPHTPETLDVFDRARLSRLKRGALFVNFGRGSAVDEDALSDLLDAGHLSGAVIDVTREEPLPADHRFWRCATMILTQHTGGGSGDEIDRKITRFLDNLARYKAGEPLIGLVDFARGY